VNKKNLNFIFFGTPDVASETLEILKQNGYLPKLIITSPDAKSGRGLQMQSSTVAIFAEKNNISCLKPENNTELLSVFSSKELSLAVRNEKKLKKVLYDLSIVVAYGKILSEEILNMPKLGSINIHYSLLPKYRGASPLESTILNGDTETGVTIQKMKLKMDSGPIIAVEKVAIYPTEKTPELKNRLIKIGGELLIQTLEKITKGKIKLIQQNEKEATFCKKIKKEDGLINLNDNAIKNYNKFRAYFSWPRTFFFQKEKRIIITDAILENGEFIIKKVLPEGKKEILWEEFKKQN